MKKKLMLILSVIAIMTMALVGCGEKKALTPEEFKSKMEEKGYEVQDITSQYPEGTGVVKAHIALKDDYQLEFYQLEDETQAANAFADNMVSFESNKDSAAVETSVSGKNSDKYTLSSGGSYMTVSRIGDTFLYAFVDESKKDEVKDIVDELGY